MFRPILIANCGEIALRIVRTAREMGLECVADFREPVDDANRGPAISAPDRPAPEPILLGIDRISQWR